MPWNPTEKKKKMFKRYFYTQQKNDVPLEDSSNFLVSHDSCRKEILVQELDSYVLDKMRK
jgi:hypothetical protein